MDEPSKFTGWCNVPLTVRGRVEAVAAGQLMRSRGFEAKRVCIAFSSKLQRAVETTELALASMAGPDQDSWCSDRIRMDWRLNERHYGAVQGKSKEDPELIQQYGSETLRHWRRSLHGKAPPMDPSHPYYNEGMGLSGGDNTMPLTESLADCQRRVLDCWYDRIAPALFEEQGHPYPPDERTIIVVAHANTIRSLMSYFDDLHEDQIPNLYVPNSVPILYRFDDQTRKPLSIKLSSSHGFGSHARWMLSAANHSAVRQAVQRGGILTRALFDALGAGKDLTISGRDLELGLRDLMKEDSTTDCVVVGVAKRIARQLQPTDRIHITEFEKLCQENVEGLTMKRLNESDFISKDFGEY